MPRQAPTLLWFRQDLRLRDNPALIAALATGSVLPVYVLDDESAGSWRRGAASRCWLHRSLDALNESLHGKLWVLKGDAAEVIPAFAAEHGAAAVHWNRGYEPWRIARDKRIKQSLSNTGVLVESHAGTLLWEPWHNLKKDGTPYKVFTPYYRNALATQPAPVPAATVDVAQLSAALHDCAQPNNKIDTLALLPRLNWHEGMLSDWVPGEAGAQAQLSSFLDAGIEDYREGRDFPAKMSVSRLSPHLHFGEISPNEAAFAANQSGQRGHESQSEHFVRELVWREFSYYLLYHFPSLTDANMKSDFDRFPWLDDADLRSAWQRGMTGYPIVDAGMRELYTTGYMHNRVRMIVASFLIKNLMQDWRHGEKWFWDCLVDADLASNSCSWQWVAGSGADAAPYFRIFNPVTQSQKFDPDGAYIRRFVPELAKLSAKHLHDPSSAPTMELQLAGIELGKDYPAAIVDLKQTRERALAAYKTLRD